MRYLLLAIIVCSSLVAGAAEAPERISTYSGALKLVQSKGSEHRFEGRVTLHGTLSIDFDMAEPNRAGGAVNFARFIPDAESVKLLPVVVSGDYASPIRHVNLYPAEVAFEAAFGKRRAAELSVGSEPTVRAFVTLTLSNFAADVECDSRVYFAHIEPSDVRPRVDPKIALAGPAHGC